MIGICDGKIALVTGAAAGIARATAVALARAGARVMASDIAERSETISLITTAGGEARSLQEAVGRSSTRPRSPAWSAWATPLPRAV